MKTTLERRLQRLALTIHEQASNSKPKAPVRLPSELWERCETLMRRANLAHTRRFIAAEKQMREQLASALATFCERIEHERELLTLPQPSDAFASPEEIFRDLVALFDEFPVIAWCTSEQRFTVTTDPIHLEGIDLGSFEIQLYWDSLDREHAYQAIAIDANPAASDESITHPHVQDGSLCEGEGRPFIRQALASGRILDFFLIVHNLLRTYNPGGAYRRLSDWKGVRCHDCGDLVYSD